MQPVPVHTSEINTLHPSFEVALKGAQTNFYDLTFEDGFTELAQQRGLQPDDTEKPAYWRAAADYAYDRSRLPENENNPEALLDELFAATPDFVYSQAALSRGRQAFRSKEAYDRTRERASYYNGLMAEVAQAWPDTDANALTTSLINVANISIEHRAVKMASPDFIRSKVRGVQHEMAFGQLLEQTGREFRSATTKEDLRGVDYVVAARGGELSIDVKASLHQIETKGAKDKAYHVGNDGQITMYSLLTDKELGGKFKVSDAVAQQKGEALEAMLRGFELLRTARNTGRTATRRWTA